MVELARALQRAGDDVLVACSARFLPEVRALGFDAVAAGLDWLEAEMETTFPELARDSRLRRDPLRVYSDVFVGRTAAAMAPDLVSLCRRFKPDVLVRNDFEFGAVLAAELLGLPCVTLAVDFFMPAYLKRSVFGPSLRLVRQGLGLPPHMPMEGPRELYVSMLPPSYAASQHLHPPGSLTVQPPSFDGAQGGEETPGWLRSLPPGPTVYFTLGTIFNRAPEVVRCVVDALRGEPYGLVVTVGRNQDPAVAGEGLPENVRVAGYVPQGLLLDRCTAVVCHGGFGTIMGALRRGLPLVTIPLSSHHPIHARRCQALGVGRVLAAGDGLSDYFEEAPPQLTRESAREAVRAVIEDPRYRARARALSEEISGLPGPEIAVEPIHRLAAASPRGPGASAGAPALSGNEA
jgi:UDP:flavonoid glycosyltransferase YjiC (YdhE family)